MLLRVESWLTTGADHSCLRRTLAPAMQINEDGMTPLSVDWDRGFFTVVVSALDGDAFVAISSFDNVDAEMAGHLLLAGQTARFRVLGGSVWVKEFNSGGRA
ncbi:hypothetical protein NKH41_12155 [Mesorhizobium sp. M1169]|uniref:hypothetical protein n=1 Tax=Mesorhizobium sp. M1169 TaxID=2957066 RepID=UPI00333BCD79